MSNFFNQHNKLTGTISFIMIGILSMLSCVLINYQIPLVAMITIISAISAYVWRITKRDLRIIPYISCFIALFSIIWMITKNPVIWTIFVTFIILFLITRTLSLAIKCKKILGKIIAILCGGAMVIVLSCLFYLTLNTSTWLKNQALELGFVNSYEPEHPSTSELLDNKYIRINDIKYADEFPRSFMDIYTVDGEFDMNKPTCFCVHGGGWIGGDKLGGDPNGTNGNTSYLLEHYKVMLDNGYNVVAINYALAPDYKYPTPLLQMTQAVNFLKDHGSEYGINTDRFIFSGGSAGGNLVCEFVTIQLNKDYAQKINIVPCLQKDNIMGLSLDVALLDPNRIGCTQTPDLFYNYMFLAILNAYYGLSIANQDKAILDSRNLINYVTADFPPVFIADGNHGSFMDQATDYYNKLVELGVDAQLYIPDAKSSVESHGFLSNLNSVATKTYIEKKVAFFEKYK